MKLSTITIKGIPLKVKIANTGREKAHGLMKIDNLPQDQGMLFCYPQERVLSFWMKNTTIPLSIAFIDKNKKVVQIEDLNPHDESSVISKVPSKWALEVNKDWFKKNNINVGSVLSLSYEKIKIKIIKKENNYNE